MFDANQILVAIRQAGPKNVRKVPMPGQDVRNGLYQIEVLTEGAWGPIAVSLTAEMADGLISRATNRLICG